MSLAAACGSHWARLPPAIIQAAGAIATTEKAMDERVGDLENLAQTLRSLPGQVTQLDDRVADVDSRLGNVESQILHLRSDMGDGVSAIRSDLHGELADRLSAVRGDLGAEMADGFSAALQIIESTSKATQMMFDQTHQIVREGDEETRRQMRVLHADLVQKISALGGRRGPGPEA